MVRMPRRVCAAIQIAVRVRTALSRSATLHTTSDSAAKLYHSSA
jgi:hypothetical protein